MRAPWRGGCRRGTRSCRRRSRCRRPRGGGRAPPGSRPRTLPGPSPTALAVRAAAPRAPRGSAPRHRWRRRRPARRPWPPCGRSRRPCGRPAATGAPCWRPSVQVRRVRRASCSSLQQRVASMMPRIAFGGIDAGPASARVVVRSTGAVDRRRPPSPDSALVLGIPPVAVLRGAARVADAGGASEHCCRRCYGPNRAFAPPTAVLRKVEGAAEAYHRPRRCCRTTRAWHGAARSRAAATAPASGTAGMRSPRAPRPSPPARRCRARWGTWTARR